jgi:Gpi18-like mannosyltransferase
MWLLYGLAQLYRWLSGGAHFEQHGFLLLLKLVPCLADVGIGLALFLVARALASPRAGLWAAACYAFSPAPVFLSASWGQWDALSTMLALLALWAVVARRPGWALPLLAYAACVKPVFGALLPLLLLAGWFAREPDHRARWRSLVVGALAAWGLLLTLCLPFGVGVPPFSAGASLRAQLAWAWDSNGARLSYNAFNLWRTPLLRGHTLDSEAGWFGWSLESWGKLLTLGVYLVILGVYARDRTRRGLLWAALATMLTLAMLPTRSHERYLLPAVALAILLAALGGRAARWLAVLLSVTFFMNLYWSYALANRAPRMHWMYTTHAVGYVIASLNVALLGLALAQGPWRVARVQSRATDAG